MADQLQTNYASDLRSILKTLFQVMATKPETDDKEKLKKGECRRPGSEARRPHPRKPVETCSPGPPFLHDHALRAEAPSRTRLSTGGRRHTSQAPGTPRPLPGAAAAIAYWRGGTVPFLEQTGPSGPVSLLQNSVCQSNETPAQSLGGDTGPPAPGGSGPL